MNGHSPGPWKQATRGPNGCPIVGDTHGLMVCMLAHSANQNEQADIAEANARLIAAAPELLEALEFVIKQFDPVKESLIFSKRLALTKASAAIAKATQP